MSQEQDATQTTATSLPPSRPTTPTDHLPANTIVFQTQHGGHLALIPIGGTVASATTKISATTTSRAPPTPSPELLPVPPRQGPAGPSLRPGTDHLNRDPLSWHAASHRDEPKRLQKLWEDSWRLGKYHTQHGEFLADFQRAGYSKAAFLSRKLAALPTPPTTILDVMSLYEVARKYDNLLEQYAHVARAALDKIAPTCYGLTSIYRTSLTPWPRRSPLPSIHSNPHSETCLHALGLLQEVWMPMACLDPLLF
jgi:hypothetical protein